MKFEKILKELIKRAREKGARSAKLISIKDIFVEDYVRQKCKYGCKLYAKRFTCPPYAPTTQETREMLKNYNRGLLIEFTELREEKDQRDILEAMFELEREAFLGGLHKAFTLVSGPCRLCVECRAEKIKNPNEFSKKYCKNPLRARPSMEACGIDVYRTVRKAGLKIQPVKAGERYKSFVLLLLE